MVSLLGIDFGDGACRVYRLNPSKAGGPIWHISRRGIGSNKLDLPKQRIALLAHLLRLYPRSLLNWKGTRPDTMPVQQFKELAPFTYRVPADADPVRLAEIVRPGEWLVYSTPNGAYVRPEYLDVWDDAKFSWMMTASVDFFIGSRAGDDPWIFWARAGI